MLFNEALKKFGLTAKEARVYLASLELGSSPVLEISRKAGLARSTTYSVLESLIKKRLVFSFIKGKVEHYNAVDPQKIKNLAQERMETIASVFPDLQELYQTARRRPRIRYYEGRQENKEMHYKILKERGLKEYMIIASEKDWVEVDPKFFEVFRRKRAKAKIKTKLILETSSTAIERKKRGPKDFSEVKLLPKRITWPYGAGIYILPNKVIILGYKKEYFSVEIESKEIADFQRMIFEFMWSVLK